MIVKFSLGLRIIHWITAVLVVVQVSLAVLNILLYEPRPILAEALVQAHISVGALILLVTLVRVVLRLLSPVPARSGSRVIRVASGCVHVLMYVCLITLPVSGYLKLAALGFEIRLFGVLTLPSLELNLALATSAREFHDAAGVVLVALIAAHIAAAVLHQRLDGARVIGHMTFGKP